MTENIKKLRECYLDLLNVFGDVCKSNGVPWCLWAGTLLGAVRHGGFIPWDDDIDVCVPNFYMAKLKSVKWPSGYSFGAYNSKMYNLCKNGTTMVNCMSKVSRRHVTTGVAGIKLDIFPLFDTPDKSGKGVKRCTTLFDRKDHQMPVMCFMPPKMAKFENTFFPIPKDHDTLLKIVYGEDYMTPKKFNNHHMHFIDLNHGQEEYASGKLKIPDRKDFKPTDGEVMFAKE